jgi:deoxycytidylate deaminase
MKTGEGYDLFDICKQENHAELAAILDAKSKNIDLLDSTLFLLGHTYCCQPCLDKMRDTGIKQYFVL